MSLPNEAAYLYSYSKELQKVHKELSSLSNKLKHHAQKHANATKEKHKKKHKSKHEDATKDAKSLVRKHKHLIKELQHHLIKFHEELRNQAKKL